MAHIKVYITFRRGAQLLETNGANFAFSLFTLPVHYYAILVFFSFFFPVIPSPCIMRACSVRFMPSLLNFASLFPFAAGTTPSIPAFVFIDILLLYVEIVCRGVVEKKGITIASVTQEIVADAAMTFEKLAPTENRSQSEMVFSTFVCCGVYATRSMRGFWIISSNVEISSFLYPNCWGGK